ncbi:BspA family leucine-rich repeat surface protein [Campylobacter sp. US33a]|uniref:BspA family leucine-rich repeat surface protein n=1 Tax=Campylobacter sp. US33a TaxID=2498120 RepID=UPI001067A9E0|nr:BspA family leucine-rich repeat surface protein [Campylobacter sp. US33a]TEY02429.1 BspA family leucine-rich repeat surface protein [Campylobacter sp. US33a]
MKQIIVENKQHLLELLKDENLDLLSLDISKLDDLSEVFKGSKRKNFSGIGTWDTSNVKNMREMFAYAEHFNENIND